MSAPPKLLAYLATKPGRCADCGWHVEKQGGHAIDCPQVETGGSDAAVVDRVLNAFIARREPFSLNELRPRLRHVGNRNVIGSRVRAAKQAGRLRETGARVASTDPGTHGHEIKVWVGVA